jgi:DNA glycosylase AlkZ-like
MGSGRPSGSRAVVRSPRRAGNSRPVPRERRRSPQELLRRRLTAQLLAGAVPRGTSAPGAVTERLLAIQAQDPRGARLAIRARSRGATAVDVDRALDAGELLITWLCRGTLHLVRTEDYPLLQALTTPPLVTSSDRRLAQEGVGPRQARRGIALIARSLRDDGPLPGGELRSRLRCAGIPVAGQAMPHLLFRAAIDGLIVRGPMDGGSEQRYALVADRMPAAPGEVARVLDDRPRALRELARRFLAGHGPACDRDLARWAGLPLRDARAGLAALGDRLQMRHDGLVSLIGAPRAAGLASPRLLGAFEPLLMGWCSRTGVLGEHDARIVTGGIFRAFALAPGPEHPAGEPVAIWRIGRSAVQLDALRPLGDALDEALARDGEAVMRFLGRG